MSLVAIRPDGSAAGVKSYPFAGEARPQTLRSSRGIEFPGLGLSSTYAAIYASQPWIYATVNKLARGIARLPLKAYQRDGEDTEYLSPFDAPLHPLPALLGRPFPRGSRFKLIESIVGSLAVYGHALVWKYRDAPGKPPVELWPLDWRFITIRTGADSPIEHFEYVGPAGKRKFLADDVIHFSWWSPAGIEGTSPLEALRVTLALEDAGRRYAVASFAHGARPSGAVKIPRRLEPDEKRELRDEIQAMNAGPDQAFRIALMDAGMEWVPFGHNAQEAETIAHRKLNREEAAAVYDLPPPVLQILDRATFSNVTEQNKALYRESLSPWLTMIDETFAAQLLWGEYAFARTFVEFDLAEVLKADLPERAAAYRNMETTLTVNERRKLENRPKIDHPAADAVLLPLNMTAIGNDGYQLGDAESEAEALAQAVRDVVSHELAKANGNGNGHGDTRDLEQMLAVALAAQRGEPVVVRTGDGASADDLEPVLGELRELATTVRTLAEKRTPTPIVNVPEQRLTRRRLLRDDEGRLAGFEEEFVT